MRRSSSWRRRRCRRGPKSPTSTSSRPPAPRTSRSPTTARCRPIPAATGTAAARSPLRPSTSAPTGSPMTAARMTARPASIATATRPISTKSDMRSASATRGRTTAARRIRPTRSMPTTPGNIRSCRISRSRNYSGSSYRYVITPQMADIYAVGSMYGAATSTRTGDTVYGFNSNAGAVFNFAAYSPAPALTIYDSGGNDTLDCSGYSAAQTIDLHAGRLFLGRRPRQQYRHRAQRGHRESHRRQRQRHADRERLRAVRCRAAAATTR